MYEVYELCLLHGDALQVIELIHRSEAIEACERLRFFFRKEGLVNIEVKLFFVEYEDDNINYTNSSEICLEVTE